MNDLTQFYASPIPGNVSLTAAGAGPKFTFDFTVTNQDANPPGLLVALEDGSANKLVEVGFAYISSGGTVSAISVEAQGSSQGSLTYTAESKFAIQGTLTTSGGNGTLYGLASSLVDTLSIGPMIFSLGSALLPLANAVLEYSGGGSAVTGLSIGQAAAPAISRPRIIMCVG